MNFTRHARQPAPIVSDPLLQWATGLQTKERRIYAGWFVEAGKLDDLDGAMAQAGFSQVTIKHGNGNLVTHWAVETANVFLLADGVQTIAETKHNDERYGIAFGWTTLEGGRQQSQLYARVLLRELLAVGYAEPLTLVAKSTLTGDVINAFMAQYDVIEAYNAFEKLAKRTPLALPLYAMSLPIGPGAEVARGSGGQTKEITPPVALVPTPITQTYIQEQWIKEDWIPRVEALIDDTIRWSNDKSAAIRAGQPEQDVEQSPAPNTRPASPQEAEARFYARYGAAIGGDTWERAAGYLRLPRIPKPTTVEGWINAAEAVRKEMNQGAGK